MENIGFDTKEVWRLAIAGITDATNFMKSVKENLVSAKYEMIIDWNFLKSWNSMQDGFVERIHL
jgi:hypothetical protein